jgi:hypothetical protein
LFSLFRFFLLPFLLAGVAGAVNWKPVDPAELALKEPKIDPTADAEALFWEVWVTDQLQGGSLPQTVFTHYVRVKIFTERGIESQSTVDLSSVARVRISDLKGRTIKSDGSIIELERAAVFEREVARISGIRARTKSFSMPNVEVGDIIEYQWREFRDDQLSMYLRLYFQRDIPSWRVTYHVKPLDVTHLGYYMQSQAFNFEYTGWEPEPQGFFGTSVENVPAFHQEPYMPPEDQVRSWLLLFYARKSELDKEKFWREHGKELYKEHKRELKIDGKIKQAAAEITAGAATEAEKVERIKEFCLTKIANIYHDRFGMTAEERGKVEDNKKPSDTLSSGKGSSNDINMLFAVLLNAAGITARPARLAGRNDRFFNPAFLNPYFLNRYNMAVQVDGGWKFYDLSSPYLTEGMLRWPEEGVSALITDPKEPLWVQTEMSGPEKTAVRRRGDFRLSPDGTLEGKVRVEYTGHRGVERKTVYDGQTPDERQKDLTEGVTARLSTAVVGQVEMENVDDLEKPFAYSYEVSVPGYALLTGKRIFLQPNYFKRNTQPLLATSERRHDIYFNYPWSEYDSITIEAPEGFVLEGAESPQSTTFTGVGGYLAKITVQDGRKLTYTREFSFGENGNIIFPSTSYSQLKAAFDFIHQQDSHTLTLRQEDSQAAAR